jgi:hypothetical protein
MRVGKYRVRRPYQLSKIGKEKRKSGLFRFCRRSATGTPAVPSPHVGHKAATAGFSPLPFWDACGDLGRTGPGGGLISSRQDGNHAMLASRRIKKLPQAGQEPVEAVESRRICPDALHSSEKLHGRQRYSDKNSHNSENFAAHPKKLRRIGESSDARAFDGLSEIQPLFPAPPRWSWVEVFQLEALVGLDAGLPLGRSLPSWRGAHASALNSHRTVSIKPTK